jgi:hypothetical protein
MDEDDPRAEIERLEAQIERLGEVLESCRKFILLARVAMAAGVVALLAITLGPLAFDPMTMMGGVAAVLGGIVLFGSNKSTFDQTSAALQAAEARRRELIGRIRLQVVGGTEGRGGQRWLH